MDCCFYIFSASRITADTWIARYPRLGKVNRATLKLQLNPIPALEETIALMPQGMYFLWIAKNDKTICIEHIHVYLQARLHLVPQDYRFREEYISPPPFGPFLFERQPFPSFPMDAAKPFCQACMVSPLQHRLVLGQKPHQSES